MLLQKRTRGCGLGQRQSYHMRAPCGHTVCSMFSPSQVSRHLTCLSSSWFLPATVPATKPAYLTPHLLLSSLWSVSLPAIAPELPRPTASLLPVSLACRRCLRPGLPLQRVLLPSSHLLLPLPARMSHVASAARQPSERVPRAQVLSLA